MKYGEPTLTLYGGTRAVFPYAIDNDEHTPGQLLERVAREQARCPYTGSELTAESVVVFGYLYPDEVENEGFDQHYEVEAVSQAAWWAALEDDVHDRARAGRMRAVVYLCHSAGTALRGEMDGEHYDTREIPLQ